jgi:imidazolonepropionase
VGPSKNNPSASSKLSRRRVDNPETSDVRTKTRPLLLTNISQLLTLRSSSGKSSSRNLARLGTELSDLGMINDAAVLCIGGKIVSVGSNKEARRDPWIFKNRKRLFEIDCKNKVVLPGFVDSHTHPVFMEPRLIDFEKRIAGATYEEIAEAGGGIRSSLDGVRNTNKSALAEKVVAALHEMAQQGTTTVEAKSGYGLTVESELKSLEAIRAAARQWPGTVISTLLAAHVVPHEFRGRSPNYVELVCREMVPEAARRKLAQFVDVFTERGAFTPEETSQIFEVAKHHGLEVRAHVGQLSQTDLQPLLRFDPASFDHVDYVSDADIRQLSRSNTVATLVPGANFFLGLKNYPSARKLIDAGVAVALATDYNPGSSPTSSMPFVMSLACTQMQMSPAEAISAATFNGAYALRLQQRKGSIESGKDADLAIFDVDDYHEIAYWIGASKCEFTVLNGNLVSNFVH